MFCSCPIHLSDTYFLFHVLQGLQFLEKQEPDIVLLDVLLPDINGIELCKMVKSRANLQHIPIIIITTLDHQEDKIQALEAGANDYLNKPIDKEELLLKIKNHLLIRRQFLKIQEQNQEINRFVELIVHDLKSPLTVIMGYSDLIDTTAGNENVKKYIQRVRHTSRRMAQNIDNILGVQYIESSHFNLKLFPFDLYTRVTELLPDWNVIAGKKQIQLKLCMEPQLPPVIGDSNKFKDVMDNLVENAVKFSHPRTGINVGAREVAGNGAVEIRVTDHGLGLTEEDKKRVFAKFQKLSAKPTAGESSTGLGLSIVKRLVELMGGDVGVRSDGKNKGAEFWFTLQTQK